MTHRPLSADNIGLYVSAALVLATLCLWTVFGPRALAMLQAVLP